MSPQEAYTLIAKVAEHVQANGGFKTFTAAMEVKDALSVLSVCVDTQIKFDKGMLTHGKQLRSNGPVPSPGHTEQ